MTRRFCLGVIFSTMLLFADRNASAAPIEVVSKPFQPRPSTFGDSAEIELSADGQWSAFVSSGTGITTNQAEELTLNVFLRNNQSGEIQLLSKSRDAGGAAGNAHSYGLTLSEDGQYIVFESEADNLVEGDDNEGTDVFLYDRSAGSLSLVSGTTNGVVDGNSGAAGITRNGRFILFETDSSEFSSLDQNDSPDLYLLERATGAIQPVTVNSNATAAANYSFQGTIGSFEGSVSGDGRYVAFISYGTNHVAGAPTIGGPQIYLRDRIGGTNAWLTRATNGAAANFVSSPVVSSNGTYVVFLSTSLESPTPNSQDSYLYLYDIGLNRRRVIRSATGASMIVSDYSISGNDQYIAIASSNQVFLYTVASDSLKLVSAASNGAPGSGVSDAPQISDDGRYVVFLSSSTNLVAGITDETYQTYVFDSQTGSISLLSRNVGQSGGANSDSLFPVISGNGTLAAFVSLASNLVTNDNLNVNDVFIVPTTGTNSVILASSPHPAAVSSTAAGGSSLEGQSFSLDGRKLIFTSLGSDIVAGDTNDLRDIFLHDLANGTNRLISVDASGAPLTTPSTLAGVSADGNIVAYVSSNRVGNTFTRALFVHDLSAGTNRLGNVLADGNATETIGDAALSSDGRYVAFRATSQGPINVRDLNAGTTVTLTAPTAPVQILGFSPGGKYLVARGSGTSYSLVDWRNNRVDLTVPTGQEYLTNAFSADDKDFIALIRATTSSATLQLFHLDEGTNATVLATNVIAASISADGSTIAYLNTPAVQNPNYSLFIYDVSAGAASPLQIAGSNAVLRTRSPISLSADGRFIAFATMTSLTGETNEFSFNDIYVYDRILKSTVLASESLAGDEGNAGSGAPLLSANGRVLVFESTASDLITSDRNQNGDVFIRRFEPIDTDSDSLEDGWEMLAFGNLSAAADADADNDGISNRNEFRAGSDPNSATSRFAISASESASGNSFVLTTAASPGRTYQLQFNANLSAGLWEESGTPKVAVSNTISFEAPLAAQGTGFFRVQAVE